MRESYVAELQKYTKVGLNYYTYMISLKTTKLLTLDLDQQVDVLGACGSDANSRNICPEQSEDCRKDLVKNYKFYLAFENSMCQDYVTEKLFYYLQHGIVPVVMGKIAFFGLIRKGVSYNRILEVLCILITNMRWLRTEINIPCCTLGLGFPSED